MKYALPEPVKRTMARIDALSLRERAILFVSLLAVLFLFANQLLFPALRVQQKLLEQQIGDKLTQLNTINSEIGKIVAQGTEDPDAAQRARIAELHRQFAELEISAADIARGLVSPRDMTRLVHSMLRENSALQLVKAENQAPEAISLDGSEQPTAGGVVVYRHGLRLQVRGRYTDIARYLDTLERLNWRVMWGEVKLETERYPMTYATLTLYTLSLDKAWIGA